MASSAPPSRCPSTTRTPAASRSSSTSRARRPAATGSARCSSTPAGPAPEAAEYAECLAVRRCPRRSPSTSTSSGVDPRGVGGSTPDRLRDVPGRSCTASTRPSRMPRTRRRYLEVSEEYVDDCEAKYGDVSRTSARRTSRATWTSVRAAMGDEQLSYLGLQLRHRDRAGVRRPVPRSCPVDGARRRRRARADRARVGRRAGRRLRDRPRSLRRVLRRRRGMRHGRRHARRRSRRCSPLAEEPGGIPADGRRPRRRPGRGQPRHQLRAVLAEPLARPSATRSPTPSTATVGGSSSWPTATSTSAPSRSTSR